MGDTFNCKRCGRNIKNPDSIIHGYGPVCWTKVKPDLASINAKPTKLTTKKAIQPVKEVEILENPNYRFIQVFG